MLAVVCLLAGAIYRIGWHIPTVDGGICSQYLKQQPTAPAIFETKSPCFDTGIDLLEGRRYQVEATANGWTDDGDPADLGGLPILTQRQAEVPRRDPRAPAHHVAVVRSGRRDRP